MSKKDGQYSVIGSGSADEPLSLAPQSKVGQAARVSTPPQPVILQQQQVAAQVQVAQPKKAVSKKSASATAAKAKVKAEGKEAEEAEDHEDETNEEIIPHKVPMSESDDEDDGKDAQGKRPSSAGKLNDEKTFLSEVDLVEMKPKSFEQAASSSSSAPGGAASRAEMEKALAAAEAAMAYRPRTEWATALPTDAIPTETFCATWSPDSRFLAVGCGEGSVRVFNASTGKVAYVLRKSADDLGLPITCIRFRPSEAGNKTKNVLLATCADGSITHWHMSSQTCLFSLKEEQDNVDSQVYACDYRADGDAFATGGRDGHVRVYDEATKALTVTLTAGRDKGTTGHSNRVYTVKYHPRDQNMLISGGWDNTIQLWDIRAGYSVRSIYGPHLCGDAMDVSPDGHTILTGSWRPNEALQRWSVSEGTLIDTIPFAAGPGGLGADRPENLYAASFSPDGAFFAAGGCGTNEGKVFSNNDKPKVVERISMGKGGVYCLSFSPSGKKIALAGGGPNVAVVDM